MMAKTSKQREGSQFICLALLVFSHVFPQSTNARGPLVCNPLGSVHRNFCSKDPILFQSSSGSSGSLDQEIFVSPFLPSSVGYFT